MNAAPGQRDPQAEQDHAKWIGWMEASTYSTHPDDCEGMAEAFAAGMQAQRDLTAPGPQPAPVSPDLECTVCQHVSSPRGVPVSAATPGQALYEALHASLRARDPRHDYMPWNELDETLRHADGWYRADFEDAGQAAIGWQRAEDATPTAEDFDHAADVISGRAVTPGQVREDWFAVLAFAAYTDRPNASEAFAAWQHLSERKRVNWRAAVDAVRMATAAAQDARPAPELPPLPASAQILRSSGPLHLPQPAPELAAYEADIASLTDQRNRVSETADQLRAQLHEIGVMAANAPEDGDSFGLLEEIAMRIAAAGVEGK